MMQTEPTYHARLTDARWHVPTSRSQTPFRCNLLAPPSRQLHLGARGQRLTMMIAQYGMGAIICRQCEKLQTQIGQYSDQVL